MNPQQILDEWASQFKSCAVNDIPLEFHQRFDNGSMGWRNIRYTNGYWCGHSVALYSWVDNRWNLEAIATYDEVMAEMRSRYETLDVPDLAEVL